MLNIISNPLATKMIQKGPPPSSSIITYVNPNITNYIISQSLTGYYTGSDGHIYVNGTLNNYYQQANLQCNQPFYLSDGNAVSINGSVVITSQSFSSVAINTPNAGQFIFQFGAITQGQLFNYIYRSSSSLEIRTTTETSAHYMASQSLGNQFNSGINQLNCWTRGIDFTGLGIGSSFRWCSLITPLHAITCNHSPPLINEIISFRDSASNIIASSSIASMSNLGGTDVQLVTFATPLPSTCIPSYVLPLSWSNYIPDCNNSLGEPVLACIIPNGNDGTIECRGWSGFTGPWSYEITTNALVPNCPFTSNVYYTGGESSSPCMMLMGGKRVFLYAMHWAQVAGPLISQPPIFSWLSSSIAPYTMSVVDLSSYQSTF